MVDFADWAFTSFLVTITAIAATYTLGQIYVQKGSSRSGTTTRSARTGRKM